MSLLQPGQRTLRFGQRTLRFGQRTLRFGQSKVLLVLFYMSLAMGAWAFIEHLPRFYSQHYTSFEIVWLRYSVHLLFMLAVFGPRHKLRLVRTRRLGLQMVRGMLMMGMHLSFIFAVRWLSLTATMASFWVAPLLLIGIALALESQKHGWGSLFQSAKGRILATVIASILCFGGVLLMSRPLSVLLHPAALLAVGMALCFALYMQMTRAMRDEDLLASLFYTAFSVWLVLSFILPFYWVTPTLSDWLVFIAIGLIGYWAIYGLDKAVEHAPTWIVAPFAFTQPIFVLVFDFAFSGQLPGRSALAGAALIAACLAFLAWTGRQPDVHQP